MVLTRGRRRQQAQQQDEEERAAQQARRERIRWVNGAFTKAPVHHLGHFLDRFDFAALQTTSATMQTSLRNVIRARSEKLPVGQRMGNLGGEFCVCEAHKELLRREGRQPGDIIAAGGFVYRQGVVNTVMSLDLVTKQYTTLAPMITARRYHATAVLGRKLFVMGGQDDGGTLASVECLDLETGQRSAVAPMSRSLFYFAAAALGGKIFVTDLTGTECFDPVTGAWTALAPMNMPRR